MTHKEYVERLGYGDVERHVYAISLEGEGEEDVIPDRCHILAAWPNGATTAHFNVPNTIIGFFDALDEADDPAGVQKLWCCDAEDDEGYLDTDCPGVIEWPVKRQ